MSRSFVVLEVGDNVTALGVPVPLMLTDKGQVLANGDGRTTGTTFLLYGNNHFDLLVPCSAKSSNIRYTWTQACPDVVMHFTVFRMLKDGACGWSALALSFNADKVPIPEDYKEPTNRYST